MSFSSTVIYLLSAGFLGFQQRVDMVVEIEPRKVYMVVKYTSNWSRPQPNTAWIHLTLLLFSMWVASPALPLPLLWWFLTINELSTLLSVENSGFFLAVSWDGCIQCTQVPMFMDHSGSPHAYLCSSFFSLSVILNIPGVWNNWALFVFRFSFPLFEPRGWTGRASCQRFMGHSLLLALCPKAPQFLHFTCVDFEMNTE